jgi:hypothetical protein
MAVSKEPDFYKNFAEEIELINKMTEIGVEEDLDPTEVALVANLERQKANLMAKKVKAQQELEDLEKNIQKIDAQIATKKVS